MMSDMLQLVVDVGDRLAKHAGHRLPIMLWPILPSLRLRAMIVRGKICAHPEIPSYLPLFSGTFVSRTIQTIRLE